MAKDAFQPVKQISPQSSRHTYGRIERGDQQIAEIKPTAWEEQWWSGKQNELCYEGKCGFEGKEYAAGERYKVCFLFCICRKSS